MKVKITKDTLHVIRADQIDAAKAVVAACACDNAKADREDQEWIATTAAKIAFGKGGNMGHVTRILEASAEVMTSQYTWNRYTDDSENLTVWTTVTAYDICDGFVMVSFNLHDLWELDCNHTNVEDIRSRMYIRRFTEQR